MRHFLRVHTVCVIIEATNNPSIITECYPELANNDCYLCLESEFQITFCISSGFFFNFSRTIFDDGLVHVCFIINWSKMFDGSLITVFGGFRGI